MDIKFQARKDGGFKCKFELDSLILSPQNLKDSLPSPNDSDSLNLEEEIDPKDLKSVKFKIELSLNGLGGMEDSIVPMELESDVKRNWKVIFTQQQGNVKGRWGWDLWRKERMGNKEEYHDFF